MAAQLVGSRVVRSSTELVRWSSYLTGNTLTDLHGLLLLRNFFLLLALILLESE
jgi:hypothetical protein